VRTEGDIIKEHNKYFTSWFKDTLLANPPPMTCEKGKLIFCLSQGPSTNVATFQAYNINGYTFYTEAKDKKSEFQNSGVTMVAATGDKNERYYGRIEEIWELDYSGEKMAMFRVRWAKSVEKEDRNFTTMVIPEPRSQTAAANVTAQYEPWVLAKHVAQCFFITDPARPSRVVVRRGKRKVIGMDGVAYQDDYLDQYGDPELEDEDDDDAPYIARRQRTTLPRSGRPFKRISHDAGLNYSTANKKGKKIVKR